MPALLSCLSLSKAYRSRPLFEELSFTLDEKDRTALIGPNGAGKSTLLKIIAGQVSADAGSITIKKHTRIAYLEQERDFSPDASVKEVVISSLTSQPLSETEKVARAEIALSKVGFEQFTGRTAELSGGWQKRLALAAQLVMEPDLLLLDEPTNHLDLSGVLWLEELLKQAPFAFLLVSHDRAFIQNVCNRTIELNPLYKDGFLSVRGPYSQFVEAREQYVTAQTNEQQSLASKARREIAWLQRGAKARQTKAQARIKQAGKLIEELAEVKERNLSSAQAGIDFHASSRKTRELLVLKGVSKSFGEKKLFNNLDLILSPGMKLGLLGTNGSGKTSLLKVLYGELQPDSGTIKRADNLQVVWFDQNRDQPNKNLTLREALCPSGDSVIYRGQQIHVASWSRRFLFRPDQLSMPVSYLSGGEQSRILCALLMLKQADILILDEPTNDLDIPTLSVLEESLQDFPGAVVLVSHDRFMLDNVSTELLALDGNGGTQFVSDYDQWSTCEQAASLAPAKEKSEKPKVKEQDPATRPLSTSEKKELARMEELIAAAEGDVEDTRRQMESPEAAFDHLRLQALLEALQAAQQKVDQLYCRWEFLESRKQLS